MVGTFTKYMNFTGKFWSGQGRCNIIISLLLESIDLSFNESNETDIHFP